MDRRIVLAYDGSLNADWVSRYAIQMAGTFTSRQLTLIHIIDGTFTRERIKEKFTMIAEEGDRHGITCQHLILEQSGDVYSALKVG